jgi:hypothetical protein
VLLKDVLYAPSIAFTLLSLSKADANGYSTLVDDGHLHILDRKNGCKVVGKVPMKNGLWTVTRPAKALENGETLLPGKTAFSAISFMDLHRCLGHISPSAVIRLVDKHNLDGIIIRDRNIDFCEVCALAKIKRSPFPKSRTHPAQNLGDVIHSDVWGPAQVTAFGGSTYAVTFIDEHTRYGTVEGLRAKSGTFDEYKYYEAWLKAQFKVTIRHLQTDRGGEYMSTEFTHHLRERGTTRQLTVHDSPPSNGIAERCNGVIVEHVRAMLIDSGLPKFLWLEAMKFAMWIRNRTTTHSLGGKAPYEALYGVKPDVSNLHLWGSRVWVRSLTAGKLDPRGREGRFIGYDSERKGYRIYWTDSHTIGVERDLIFEDRPITDHIVILPDPFVSKDRPQLSKPSEAAPPPQPKADPPVVEAPPPTEPTKAKLNDTPTGQKAEPRPPGRIRKPSRYVLDVLEGKVDGGTARGKSRLPRGVQLPSGTPATGSEPTTQTADTVLTSLADISIDDDPKTIKEAMDRSDWPEWQKAIDDELELMAKYQVWDVVEEPPDKNIVGCRWVFRIKHDAEGRIQKYKARLVAQGFTQIHGIDFLDTFAPVARLSAIRTVVALAASENWELHQMDVKSAYLNSPIDAEIYMRLPPGYGQKGMVAKLNRGLYGLRQSGNLWHKTLSSAFNDLRLTRSAVDHGVFYTHDSDGTTILCSSTDDFLITASSVERMTAFKSGISQHFEMTDLGELGWILGIRVKRDRISRTISLSQAAYIDLVVKRFNLSTAPPLQTPIDPNAQISKAQSPTTDKQIDDMRNVPYREAIGSLMYASIGTRPDITFAVTLLSQYLQNPGRAHWEQAKRVIRYLKGTRDRELKFGPDKGVEGFSDANWGNNTDDRHSICGYVFMLNGGAISWSSNKQSVVALSSTEAEYIGITHAAKEAIWIRHLLSELHSPQVLDYPLLVHCDNKSAIELAKNATFHSRTKHIAIRFHYIREALNDGVVTLEHRGTDEMPADMFTKALIRVKLNKFAQYVGLSQT